MGALEKMLELAKKEVEDNNNGWWWLSFADDDGFKGALLIFAPGFHSAMGIAHLTGLNPGGQVQGLELPRGTPTTDQLMFDYSGRLLTAEECAAFDLMAEASMNTRDLN